MSFKRKVKKMFRNVIGDFSDVKWKDLDHKKVYLALAALVLVLALLIALIVGAFKGGEDKTPNAEETPGTDIVAQEQTPEVTEEADLLETDAYPEINALVEKYFTGLSSGDHAMVAETVDVLTEEEKKDIEGKKDYIEAYQNVVCHTKKGLETDSYVVFAAYEMKIYNIETAAPGIMALYVCKGEDGAYRIFNGEASEELTEFVLALAAEEEVAAVISEVDARYQQLLTEDEDLGKFVQTMLQAQQEPETEEVEAPAEEGTEETAETEQEEENTEETAEAEQEEESTEETQEEAAEVTSVNKLMQFKEAVRIRADRSADSERLTNAYAKELVTVIENYSDGWSKVNYNDIVGYCKTEFLEEAQ